MAEHLGGESLGAPQLTVGEVTKTLDGITVEGEAHAVDLVIGGTMISTGAAFLSANPTGAGKLARGADDVDKFLDAMYLSASFRVDEKRFLFQNELLSRMRSLFSLETGRDVEVTGALVDGTSIPISTGAAIPFSLRMPIPLSVRDELFDEDGDIYKQGTELLKAGVWQPNHKALVAGGVVNLANGNATVAGLTFDLQTHVDPAGDKFYVGPTLLRHADIALPAVVTDRNLPRAKRVLLAVDGVGSGPYTMDGDVKTNKMTAAGLNSMFNRNRRRNGGDNTTARVTVLVFPRKGLKLAEMDFTPTTVYVKDEAAPATQVFLSSTHQPVDASVSARAEGDATTANKNQPVSRVRPTPPSAIGTNAVHTRNASVLGVHFVKGSK